MAIEKENFVPYRDQEERDKDSTKVFSIRLNDGELLWLQSSAEIIGQEKLTTAIKQLAKIGSIVIQDTQNIEIINVIFGNIRRNQRLGINIPEPKFKKL